MLLKRKENNKKIKNKKFNIKGSQLIIVGSLLILGGLSLVGGKYFYNYLQNKEEDNKLQDFYEVQEQIDNTDEEITNNVDKLQEEKKEISVSNEEYIAVIKIPKIGLEKGLYKKGSYNNNVNKNIQILNDSSYPDEENGNFILAGHSGNGRIAYFKNLHKLEREDQVSVFYNGSEYRYKVVNMYDIEKTGSANIIRNANKSTLTLVTCRHNTNKQIIIICELVEKV